MIHHVIAQIICSEFRKAFQTPNGLTERNKGMKIGFKLNIDHDREEGFRNLEVLIFGGGSTYISVFARLNWTVVPVEGLEEEDGLRPGFDYTKGETPWVHFSCHDSCWTSDGVENILYRFRDRINILDSRYDRWYETVDIGGAALKEFSGITSDTRNGKLQHSGKFEDLEFRFAQVG